MSAKLTLQPRDERVARDQCLDDPCIPCVSEHPRTEAEGALLVRKGGQESRLQSPGRYRSATGPLNISEEATKYLTCFATESVELKYTVVTL